MAEVVFGDERFLALDALIALARHRRDWLRDPWSWKARTHNARRQLASFLRHMVARYPVPAFLDGAWVRSDKEAARYRDWYLALGRGENIRRLRSPLPLSNRIVHHFLRAPEGYPIEHALRFGQVVALGGLPRLVEPLVATRLGEGFAEETFWGSVVRFLVRHAQIPLEQVGPIVDYLHHERFVSEVVFVAPGLRRRIPPAQPNLSMKGRSPERLLRDVRRWHRELGVACGKDDRVWAASGIGALEYEVGKEGEDLKVWRVRELLSSAELRSEGSAMRHCVATYARSAEAHQCSIWSVELSGFRGVQKRLTIEVRGDTIVQCRGRANVYPTEGEMEIVRRWARLERLTLGVGLRIRGRRN